MERSKRAELTRRGALGILAGTGAAFALGCGSSAKSARDDMSANDLGVNDLAAKDLSGSDAATGATDLANASGDLSNCEVTPEGEIGPYFSDDSDARFNRSNVLTDLDGTNAQSGITLTLNVTVVDVENSCAPYANAQIDLWSCNAAGVYSDQSSESTSTHQWLRGYQLTDANGRATFVTIIPGWYSGRTTHIHLRVRSKYSTASSTSDGTNTTQIFFQQTFIDNLATSVAPYSSEGKNPTTNASDHVYSGETNGANVLSLAGSAAAGYTTSITIGLPIAAATTGTTTGGGGPPGM